MKHLLSFFIFFLFLIPTVQAIGVTPSKAVIGFEAEFTDVVELKIHNNGNEEIVTEIIENEENRIAPFIEFNETNFNIPVGKSYTVKYTVTLPKDTSTLRPGRNSMSVMIRGVPLSAAQGGFFSIATAIYHIIHIETPFEGKYIEAELSATSAKQNEDSEITLTLTNLGTETVEEVIPLIIIADKEERSIDSFNFKTITNLEPNVEETIKGVWNTQSNPAGKYNILASIQFDGSAIDEKSEFSIGALELELLNLSGKLTKGTISKVQLDVQSKWTETIEEVTGELLLEGPNQTKISAKVEPFEIKSLQIREIPIYIELPTDIPYGKYTAKPTLYYENKNVSGEYVLPHDEQKEEKKSEEKEGNSLTIILIAASIIIILLLIIIILLLRKKDDKKSNTNIDSDSRSEP